MKKSVKKALTNYYNKNKQLNITISNEIYELFINYCKQNDITKKEAIETMITYCIDNNILNWYILM